MDENTSAVETLSPARRLLIGALTLAMAAAGFAAGRTALRPATRVLQPVQFNHQKHVKDVGLECASCHEYFATGEHSGLPSLELCEGCHSEALTKSSEEQTLLKLIASKPQPAFHKLFRMPDHVRYSHRRHVTAGGLPCETCHGGIAETTAPPPVALTRITMDTCTNCHVERGVRTDCTACHR
jgi:menaquinone reductase, multiheme cytochrome c subunit